MTGVHLGVGTAEKSVVSPGGRSRWRRLAHRLASAAANDAAARAYALALAIWASSWNLRFSVLMAWSPIEPVWIGSGAVAVCVVHRLGKPLRLNVAVAGPLLLLMLGFLPGALHTGDDGYGPTKVSTLIFVLVPVVLAATVLLDSREARRAWLWAQLFVGVAVAIAASMSNQVSTVQPGRFSLATVDTIATARFVGVAVVALLLLGLTSLRHAWWALPLAAMNGMVLVHVGSRGPFTFVLLSVLLVVLAAHCFAGRRLEFVLVLVLLGVAAYSYALAGGQSGGRRIVDSLRSGLDDDARDRLRESALHLGLSHPFGIGWGDFAQESAVGNELANAQGVAYAHNAFAEAFAEGGVTALLTLAIIVLLALARMRRLSGDYHEAIVLGTIIYWLLNAQVSLDLVGNRFMWLSLACGLAAYSSPLKVRAPNQHVLTSREGRRPRGPSGPGA